MVGTAAALVSFAEGSELLGALAGLRRPGEAGRADGRGARAGDRRGRTAAGRARDGGRDRAHAVPGPGWHGGADAQSGGGRPAGQAGGRVGQDARSEAVHGLECGGAGRRRRARAGRGLGLLLGRHRARRDARHGRDVFGVRPAGGARGAPARLRPGAPAGRPGRWGPLDLEPCRRILPRGHPDRGSLPRQRTPQRGGEGPLRGAERPRGRLGARRATPNSTPGSSTRSWPPWRPSTARAATPAKREAVRKCIGYLWANRRRMRYPAFRAQGLCTSTAVVEAGCKVAIGTRLKRAGMHWTVRGANAIIALRCCKLSGRFEDFWERRAERRAAS